MWIINCHVLIYLFSFSFFCISPFLFPLSCYKSCLNKAFLAITPGFVSLLSFLFLLLFKCKNEACAQQGAPFAPVCCISFNIVVKLTIILSQFVKTGSFLLPRSKRQILRIINFLRKLQTNSVCTE